jgi:hypothetical protein
MGIAHKISCITPCLLAFAVVVVQVGDVKLDVRTPQFILDKRTAPVRKTSVLVMGGTPECSTPQQEAAAAARRRRITTSDVDSVSAAIGVAPGTVPEGIAGTDGYGSGAEATKGRMLTADGAQCVQERQLTDMTMMQGVRHGLEAADGGAGHQAVVVPQGLTGEQVKELLGKYDKMQWLHFSNVTQVFTRFASEELQQQFEGLLREIIVPWCCRNWLETVQKWGMPQRHWHVIRPWGSNQDYCVRREGDGTVSYFCDN